MATQPLDPMMSNNQQDERVAQERTEPPVHRVQEASQPPLVEEHTPQRVPSRATGQAAQQDEFDETAVSNLIHNLIRSSPSVFDAVIAYYDPPSGVAETGTKANKARELVNTARNKGDLQKLVVAYQLAIGDQPFEKKNQQKLTDDSKKAVEVARQAMSTQLNVEKDSSEEPLPSTLRGCLETAQRNVELAYELLDPKMSILPEDIVNAAQYLENTKRDIEHLEELLQKAFPLPVQGRIIDQVSVIIDQIEVHLLPYLRPSELLEKHFQERFAPLLKALNILDSLISK